MLTTLVAALYLGAAADAVGSPDAPTFLARPRPVHTSQPALASQPTGRAIRSAAPAPAPHRGRGTKPTAAPAPVVRRPDVSAFGDSVLLGARTALGSIAAHLDVDAVEGRQPYEVLDDVLARAKDATLQPDVVIHTGNNGIISPDQLRTTLAALRDRTRVVLVTDRVPRDWQDPNNATITGVAKGFRNVVVLDWHTLSAGRNDWLYSDGLHLTPAGARAYARLVRRALTSP